MESVRARQQEAETKKKHVATQEQLTKELTRAKALHLNTHPICGSLALPSVGGNFRVWVLSQ